MGGQKNSRQKNAGTQQNPTLKLKNLSLLPFPKLPMACPTLHPVPVKTPDSADREEKQLDVGD